MKEQKRYLVTGGAGFIGSHLVDRLLNAGHKVTILDDFNPYYSPEIKQQNLSSAKASGRLDLVVGDICSQEDVERAFQIETPDAVLHLAARAGVRASIADPILYVQVNCLGTTQILEACVRHGIKKVIFASSSSVYGEADTVPFVEDMVVDRPISPYAATKRAAEIIAYNYSMLHQIDITCLRFFTVYGPRQRPEMAIYHFMKCIDEGTELSIFGDGTTSRDYTYIDDIIDGVELALQKVEGYQIYNIGSGAPITLLNLIQAIGDVVGKSPVTRFAPMQQGDVSRTYADVSRATSDLGFRPSTPLKQGLEQMSLWKIDLRNR